MDFCRPGSHLPASAALGLQAFGSWVFGSRVFGPRAFWVVGLSVALPRVKVSGLGARAKIGSGLRTSFPSPTRPGSLPLEPLPLGFLPLELLPPGSCRPRAAGVGVVGLRDAGFWAAGVWDAGLWVRGFGVSRSASLRGKGNEG